jgi:hypothetical protein
MLKTLVASANAAGGILTSKQQGELFDDGSRVRHCSVLSNLWGWKAAALIAWHREKAGTIEVVHDAIKNELGGGAIGEDRFMK